MYVGKSCNIWFGNMLGSESATASERRFSTHVWLAHVCAKNREGAIGGRNSVRVAMGCCASVLDQHVETQDDSPGPPTKAGGNGEDPTRQVSAGYKHRGSALFTKILESAKRNSASRPARALQDGEAGGETCAPPPGRPLWPMLLFDSLEAIYALEPHGSVHAPLLRRRATLFPPLPTPHARSGKAAPPPAGGAIVENEAGLCVQMVSIQAAAAVRCRELCADWRVALSAAAPPPPCGAQAPPSLPLAKWSHAQNGGYASRSRLTYDLGEVYLRRRALLRIGTPSDSCRPPCLWTVRWARP